MRIALIGRGRVATHMGKALLKAGHKVVSVNSRTLAELPQDADVYIIAVKDSALQEVISKVTKGREGQLFLHTAGSMPLSVFEGYADNAGVLYPMQTFSMDREVDFREIPLFIEGADPRIRAVAESLSAHVYELSTADRKYLHLAAVFACNFANHCFTLSDSILQANGLDFSVMLPLVEETVAKLHDMPPAKAQTGPAVRRDQNVMGLQRAMLTDRPDMQRLYTLLSESIMRGLGDV